MCIHTNTHMHAHKNLKITHMQTGTQTQTFTGRHTTHIHTYAYTQFLREKVDWREGSMVKSTCPFIRELGGSIVA